MRFHSELSSAVLTPELIHPNYYHLKKTHSHSTNKSRSKARKSIPLRKTEIQQRYRWCTYQLSILANIRSTAVLGACVNAK